MLSCFPRFVTVAVLLSVVIGCKVVKNEDRDEKSVGNQSADKIETVVNEVWATRALPHIRKTAAPLDVLTAAIGRDLDAAGEAHGYRPGSEGSPWSFAVEAAGVVVTANTESRAASAEIDIDGDGTSDAVVQLGPVIKGTALRDILPFLSFTDFRDQIEYAKLARALNARANNEVLVQFPRDNLVGERISLIGVFSVRTATDVVLITPVSLTPEVE